MLQAFIFVQFLEFRTFLTPLPANEGLINPRVAQKLQISKTAKQIRHSRRIVRFSASGVHICAIFGIPYISHPNITAARLTDGSCQKSQNSERAKHIRSGHIIVSFGASGIHICNIFEIPCISHLRQWAC